MIEDRTPVGKQKNNPAWLFLRVTLRSQRLRCE